MKKTDWRATQLSMELGRERERVEILDSKRQDLQAFADLVENQRDAYMVLAQEWEARARANEGHAQSALDFLGFLQEYQHLGRGLNLEQTIEAWFFHEEPILGAVAKWKSERQKGTENPKPDMYDTDALRDAIEYSVANGDIHWLEAWNEGNPDAMKDLDTWREANAKRVAEMSGTAGRGRDDMPSVPIALGREGPAAPVQPDPTDRPENTPTPRTSDMAAVVEAQGRNSPGPCPDRIMVWGGLEIRCSRVVGKRCETCPAMFAKVDAPNMD